MSTNAATSFDAITQIISRIERAAGVIGKAAVQMADADGTVRAQLEVPIGGLQSGQDHPLIVQQPIEHMARWSPSDTSWTRPSWTNSRWWMSPQRSGR